jgi:hypothetical protein
MAAEEWHWDKRPRLGETDEVSTVERKAAGAAGAAVSVAGTAMMVSSGGVGPGGLILVRRDSNPRGYVGSSVLDRDYCSGWGRGMPEEQQAQGIIVSPEGYL